MVVHSPGLHNANSGPDFFNGQVSIAQVLWAGNIEIHVRSTSWYKHKHHEDPAYDNVVLHVVWHFDERVYRKDGSEIPTIELQHWVSATTVAAYKKLFRNTANWIPCERDFRMVDDFTLRNWMERLFIQRLENRTDRFARDLENLNNDWEALFFQSLAAAFGTKVNSESFRSVAQSVDFSVVRKCATQPNMLEALLMGQAGLLEGDCEDLYFRILKDHYSFLNLKYAIHNDHIISPKFFRLRPNNFPTIRLSQLAALYCNKPNLFSKLLEAKTKDDYYHVLHCEANDYWDTHYSFGKQVRNTSKRLHTTFLDLLLINVVLPLKFFYLRENGRFSDEEILVVSRSLKAESNTIIRNFDEIGVSAEDLLESQALLELKTNYCDTKKCLQCAIGNKLIRKKL